MNSFQSIPLDSQDPTQQSTRRLESLVTELFRSIFPQVTPMSTPLTSVKRVLLLNREPSSDDNKTGYNITLRHYAINTKRAGLAKPIKRINAAEKVHKTDRKGKGVPDLGRLGDVSEYFLDPQAGNYTSASESEAETDAEVEVLAQRQKRVHYKDKLEKIRAAANGDTATALLPGSGHVEKRGIILSELGPRMKLRLLKVEEGLCEGKVLWHHLYSKSPEQERELEKIWSARNQEKEERRKKQKENIALKRKEKKARGQKEEGDEDEDEDEEMEDYDDWEDDFMDEDIQEDG